MLPHAPIGLGQLHVSTDDLDASIHFYTEVLGLPLLFRVPGQPMAFVQAGQTRLYLGTPESEAFRSRSLMYLWVDDVFESYRAITDRGATFVGEPTRGAPHRHRTVDGVHRRPGRQPRGDHAGTSDRPEPASRDASTRAEPETRELARVPPLVDVAEVGDGPFGIPAGAQALLAQDRAAPRCCSSPVCSRGCRGRRGCCPRASPPRRPSASAVTSTSSAPVSSARRMIVAMVVPASVRFWVMFEMRLAPCPGPTTNRFGKPVHVQAVQAQHAVGPVLGERLATSAGGLEAPSGATSRCPLRTRTRRSARRRRGARRSPTRRSRRCAPHPCRRCRSGDRWAR